MMKRLLLIIILMTVLLLITPCSARTVTAKVDDKGVLWVHNYGIIGTVHTDYGWITVNDNDYNQIMVNDTIEYDTDLVDDFWSCFWSVKVKK